MSNDPLDLLRSEFAAAAHREIAPASPAPRRRRSLWKWAAVLGAAAATTGGLATAVDLISVGTEKKVPGGFGHEYDAPEIGGTIALTAAGDPLPFGVLKYRVGEKTCAMTGQLRGERLGAVEDGVFHPYPSHHGAVCWPLKPRSFIWDITNVGGRTVAFGLGGTALHRVSFDVFDGPHVEAPFKNGVFIAVLDDPNLGGGDFLNVAVK